MSIPTRIHSLCQLATAALTVLCLHQFRQEACHAEEGFVTEERAFRAQYDETEQRYVLMTPQQWDRAQPVSILIALHGHGSDRWQFVRQMRDECRAVREVAAEAGMVLVSPDYRAKTSWMGPAAEADLVQLIEILKKRYQAERVIVCGGSMGGTAALTFAVLHPDLVDGVVSLNGTANLVDYDGFQDAIAESFGGTRRQIPDEYRKRSAEFFPERLTMPVAATTGGQDKVVPCDSVLRLLKSLKQHNDDVLNLHRPDGGHSTDYEDTRQALQFVLDRSAVRRHNRSRTIVTFGDSTTAPRGTLPVYTQLLTEALAAQDPSFKVINAGIGGNNTNQAKARFETDVLSRKPDTVIIQFGINDSAVDVWKDPPATHPRVALSRFTENLTHFVNSLRQAGVQVILMTPNPLRWTDKLKRLYGKPPYQSDDPDGFNVLLSKYADAVRQIAASESVPLVDVDRLFRRYGCQEGQSVDDLLLDGMHPNAQGHRIVADAILKGVLKPIRGGATSRNSLRLRPASSVSGPIPAALKVQQKNQPANPLIASVTKETLWRNRDGKSRTWFHPRACMVPDEDGQPMALMNLQEIGGSDYFGPVHWSVSRDLGKTWSDPKPISAFGRDSVPGRTDGLKAGVCDVTPQYHPQTDTVIALGHVVFYKGQYFARKEQLARYPVYAIRAKDGTWSERKILRWDDPRGAHIYSNNCGQRVIHSDGTVRMSFTFGPEAVNRMVAGVHVTYDGHNLKIAEVGPPLHNPKGRGLLEPSVTTFDEKFWITIRAEDGRGYVSVSEDGLHWEEKKAWMWDDGTPLDMSTTQQHWLTHSDGLFLVYTRKDASNTNVIRWRSPLWVAQVDVQQRCLIRTTERVVLPLVGDGVDKPDGVALMGNFNVTNVSPDESWVTVGEWMPRSGYRGDVLLARIRWSRPNRLPLW